MEEPECLICNCNICKDYKSNIYIAQSCHSFIQLSCTL